MRKGTKAQKKRRKALFSALVLLLALLLPACARRADPLKAVFLKAGKADAILLTCGGQTMAIDTGETDDAEKLISAARSYGAERIDFLIVTHFDRDHVGGAAALIEALPAANVLLPDYEGDSDEYRAFTAAMEKKGIVPQRLTEPLTFSFGPAAVTVDPPSDVSIAGTSDDADNELSLIVTVEYGETRLLFAGDAEDGRLTEWLGSGAARPCDLLKVPHHGKYGKALVPLLAAVSPGYAVICDSEKNPADEKTLALLKEAGAKIYETKDGDIRAESDGKTVKVRFAR